MLTYDDLDHFDERTMAGLFDPAVQSREAASAQRRRERILACLHFCRDVPSGELRADGLLTARQLLRRALRSHLRDRQSPSVEMVNLLGAALEALGGQAARRSESIEAAALRHLVEREIETAARARSDARSAVPQLFEKLVRGDFEIGTQSDLSQLHEGIRKFSGGCEIELQLVLDGDDGGGPAEARVHMAMACGIWRWSVLPGCHVAVDQEDPVELAADDEILRALLAGLSVQNGRPACLWASSIEAAQAEEGTPA